MGMKSLGRIQNSREGVRDIESRRWSYARSAAESIRVTGLPFSQDSFFQTVLGIPKAKAK